MNKFAALYIVLVGVQLSFAKYIEEVDNEESTRIVNGQQARSGQFPWMVGVHPRDDNGHWYHWFCGGALISKNLVLTAKHCVDLKQRSYRVTLGSTLAGDSQDGDGKTIRYVDLSIHRGDTDFMILRLSQSVSFTNKIQPIRLPSANDYLGGDVDVTISGWGGTGESNSGGQSHNLLYTVLRTISNKRCADFYGTVKDDIICYVNQHSTTCGGDSGSPVVRYINGVAYHIGVHNAGTCKVGMPSLATRTSANVNWINDEIRRHSQ